jgi:transcriptional regulator NrdR family protein
MIKHVIKKNGEKEVFDEQKIKRGIMAAAKEAGLTEERIREVMNEVYEKLMMDIKDKEEVATQMIREKVLDALDKTEKSVADAWRKYEESKHAC